VPFNRNLTDPISDEVAGTHPESRRCGTGETTHPVDSRTQGNDVEYFLDWKHMVKANPKVGSVIWTDVHLQVSVVAGRRLTGHLLVVNSPCVCTRAITFSHI
jgi:hypothetical protein